MRKMKLDVEQLSVESFTVKNEDMEVRGTVRGNAVTERFWRNGKLASLMLKDVV